MHQKLPSEISESMCVNIEVPSKKKKWNTILKMSTRKHFGDILIDNEHGETNQTKEIHPETIEDQEKYLW